MVDTEFEEMLERLAKAKKRELPVLRPAPKDCKSCGACCSHFQEINVLHDDENLPWLKAWNLVEKSESGSGEWLMKQQDGRCIAFSGIVGSKAQCTIYPHRPEGCETFEAGGSRCRSVIILDVMKIYG